jgi:hypothetical protein
LPAASHNAGMVSALTAGGRLKSTACMMVSRCYPTEGVPEFVLGDCFVVSASATASRSSSSAAHSLTKSRSRWSNGNGFRKM